MPQLFPNIYRHNTDRSLVTVSQITDSTVTFHPTGGGWQLSMPAQAFHEQFSPDLPDLDYKPVLVTLDCFDEPVTGYTTEYRWNGWVVPYFDWDTAMLILQKTEHKMSPDSNPATKHLSVYDEGWEEWKTCDVITIDDVPHYNVMEGWTWFLADEQEEG